MSANCEWEIQNLKARLDRIELHIFGNGTPGTSGKILGLEKDVDDIKDYLDGWKMVTNYDDYKSMKRSVEDLTKKVYLTGAALAILMSLLKIAPPDILQHLFR